MPESGLNMPASLDICFLLINVSKMKLETVGLSRIFEIPYTIILNNCTKKNIVCFNRPQRTSRAVDVEVYLKAMFDRQIGNEFLKMFAVKFHT